MLDSEVYRIRTFKTELRHCGESFESREKRRWLCEVGKMHGMRRGLTANRYEDPELPLKLSFFPR